MADDTIQETPAEIIDMKVENAQDAFGPYRQIDRHRKAAFLLKIGELINARRADLSAVAARETSLTPGRLEVEIRRTVHQLHMFAGLIKEGSWVKAIVDQGDPGRTPLPRPDLRNMQQPLGVVAVFGASNFPFAYSVAGGDTAAALAAGCPVVYKGNPGHPQTSERVAALVMQAIGETGMPAGLFSLVQGASVASGQRLVMHPLVKAVGFTGSLKGGRAIYDAAARRPEPIPVYAEMGSVNPVFILPGILKEKSKELARILATSNTMGAGQFCTNPGIMISPQSADAETFLSELAGFIRQTAPSPMLNKSIQGNFENSIRNISGKKHVALLAASEKNNENQAKAYVFRIGADEFMNDEELWEETFGPSSVQVISEEIEDIYRIAEALPGQLTASVWGTEKDLGDHAALVHLLELKAGRIIINGVPTGVEVSPAMNHGGPYPATTDPKFTSVGTQSIYRFTRPVCYQNYPQPLLPAELRNENKEKIWRLVDGKLTKEDIADLQS